MTPTPKLRFVERQHGYKSMSSGEFIGNTVHILQQWWAPEDATENEIRLELVGDWRDVPLEKE